MWSPPGWKGCGVALDPCLAHQNAKGRLGAWEWPMLSGMGKRNKGNLWWNPFKVIESCVKCWDVSSTILGFRRVHHLHPRSTAQTCGIPGFSDKKIHQVGVVTYFLEPLENPNDGDVILGGWLTQLPAGQIKWLQGQSFTLSQPMVVVEMTPSGRNDTSNDSKNDSMQIKSFSPLDALKTPLNTISPLYFILI